MPTTRFGLTDSNDNRVIDAVLAAFEGHNHTGGTRLGDPTGTPTVQLITEGGLLPGSSTFYYRAAFVDQFGFESAASDEVGISTPVIVPNPDAPESFSDDGGLLAPGVYYIFLSALTGLTETSLSSPTTIALQPGEGTIKTSLPINPPEGVTQYRVWRQGPGEAGPTKIGLLDLDDVELVDDGSVEPDDCACDPSNLPPDTNLTNSDNQVIFTLGDADAALVVQANSPVKRWRLYRSSVSGSFSESSLLHEVVEVDDDGVLLTSWTDAGDEDLAAGQPSDISRTLQPSPVLTGYVEDSELTAALAGYVAKPSGPADGAAMTYNAALGMWVATTPTGNSELAYAINTSGTTQSTSGAAIDITSCSIAVPASARPVYLTGACTMQATAVAAGSFAGILITEVSNGVDTPMPDLAAVLPTVQTGAYSTVNIPAFRLGPTLRTRTFKLQALGGGATITIINGASYPSLISAESR